jgi:hypothetical protein
MTLSIITSSKRGVYYAWKDRDLTTIAHAPPVLREVPLIAAYVRSDGVSAVLYTAEDLGIHELALSGSAWSDANLSDLAHGRGGYLPMGYVRSDAVSAVVYRNDVVHELVLTRAGWSYANLSSLTRGPRLGGWMARGYVRADKRSVVVYESEHHIHEMALVGRTWQPDADLTAIAQAAVEVKSTPWGYVRGDGVSAVVYRGADDHVHELSLRLSFWQRFLQSLRNFFRISTWNRRTPTRATYRDPVDERRHLVGTEQPNYAMSHPSERPLLLAPAGLG